MRRFRVTQCVVAGVLAVAFAGCAQMGAQPAAKPADKTLYERLGGQKAIEAVIDDFIGNVAADARINKRFANANIPRLKKNLVDQVCQVSGGPCRYTGLSMKEAHRGMKITDAEFNALVEDLVKSLDKFKVPAREKNELLTPLAKMKGDIVGQ
jgi:hemoglobin